MNKLKYIIAVILFTGSISIMYAGEIDSVIVRGDNDLLAYKDGTSPKEAMNEALNLAVTWVVKDVCSQMKEACSDYKEIYLQTFKITSPKKESLFVIETYNPAYGLMFSLLYTEEGTYKFPVSSPLIMGKYMYNNEEMFKDWNGQLLEKPIISFRDIDSNGTYEVIFNCRLHFGKENTVETRVFRPVSRTEIREWFKYNSKEIIEVNGALRVIKRNIKKIESSKLTLSQDIYTFTDNKYLSSMDDMVIEVEK